MLTSNGDEKWYLSLAVKTAEELIADGLPLDDVTLTGSIIGSGPRAFSLDLPINDDTYAGIRLYNATSTTGTVQNAKKIADISAVAQTETGTGDERRIAQVDWFGASAPSGVSYIPKGETVYFALMRNDSSTGTDRAAVWDNYVSGASIDANWTVGGEYVEDVYFTKQPYHDRVAVRPYMTKWFLAVKVKDDVTALQMLKGDITLTKTGIYGFSTPDNQITLSVDTFITQTTTPPESLVRVMGIDSKAQTEQGDLVGLYHWDGAAAPDGATYGKYSNTLYFSLKDGYGDVVADEQYVDGTTISAAWEEGGDYVSAIELVKKAYNGTDEKYFVALTLNDGSGFARLKGTISATNSTPDVGFIPATIELPVDLLLAEDISYPTTADNSQVTQISSGTNGALVKHSETGVVSNYNWRGETGPSTGVTYIPYGETVYYYLRAEARKSGSKNVVENEEYVWGTTFDVSGLDNHEYIDSVSLEKHTSIASGTEVNRYFLAIKIKDDGPADIRLTGTIKMTNDIPFYGFDAPGGTLSYTLDLGLGMPTTTRVAGIDRTLLCEYRDVVKSQTISGESVTGLTRLPYGYVAYYALVDEQGDPVYGDVDLTDVTVTANFGANQHLVEKAELVAKRYDKDSQNTMWFVAVHFSERPDGAANQSMSGSITLKHNGGNWADDFAQQTISASTSLTLIVLVPSQDVTPTPGDPARVLRFAEFGTRAVGIWPLIENEDGGLERVVGATGTTYTGSEPMVPYGSTIYYPLADCEGNLVTDERYVKGISISANWINYGQRLKDIRIVLKRLELGDGVHDGVYGYCLALDFVDRDYSSRSNVVGEVKLRKRGSRGIATDNNELLLWVDFYLTKNDATLNPNYTERHQFQGRVLSEVSARYNFVDPAYGEGGNNWALGTDKEDVIYLTDEMTSYFTVDTRGQGRMQLGCSTQGNPYFYDVYPEAKLEFLLCSGDAFNKNGVLTIQPPEPSWHLYEIVNGIIVEPANVTFDEQSGTWQIRTKKLGKYCMSDIELDLDRQFFFEYDESHYATEGKSAYKPTERITVDMLSDAQAEWYSGDTVSIYVKPGVALSESLLKWASNNLTKSLHLLSNWGWEITLEPQMFPQRPTGGLVIHPYVHETDHSVIIELSGNDALRAYAMELPLTITHERLATMNAPRIYGKTTDGHYVDFGPVTLSDNTATFTFDRDMTYIITDMQLPNVIADEN